MYERCLAALDHSAVSEQVLAAAGAGVPVQGRGVGAPPAGARGHRPDGRRAVRVGATRRAAVDGAVKEPTGLGRGRPTGEIRDTLFGHGAPGEIMRGRQRSTTSRDRHGLPRPGRPGRAPVLGSTAHKVIHLADRPVLGGRRRCRCDMVLQHIRCEPPGSRSAGHARSERGVAIQTVELDEGGAPARLARGGLVAGDGRPDGSLRRGRASLARRGEAVDRAAVRAGMPYLGVCLGAQLLAATLGAAVRPGDTPRGRRPAGRGHRRRAAGPGVRSLATSSAALQWHGDTFAISRPGAVPSPGRPPTRTRRSGSASRVRRAVPRRGDRPDARRVGAGARVPDVRRGGARPTASSLAAVRRRPGLDGAVGLAYLFHGWLDQPEQPLTVCRRRRLTAVNTAGPSTVAAISGICPRLARVTVLSQHRVV